MVFLLKPEANNYTIVSFLVLVDGHGRFGPSLLFLDAIWKENEFEINLIKTEVSCMNNSFFCVKGIQCHLSFLKKKKQFKVSRS